MFSPNIVGTANAFAGGWGNMGALISVTALSAPSACCSMPAWQ